MVKPYVFVLEERYEWKYIFRDKTKQEFVKEIVFFIYFLQWILSLSFYTGMKMGKV